MSPAVLFLDFDRVLNTAAWQRETVARFPGVVVWSPEIGAALLSPEHCARVQRVCDATGAPIVLATGWRRWMPGRAVATLTPLLRAAGITAPVIDEVGQHFSGDGRATFIAEWLDERRDVTRWCVLDDGVHYYADESPETGARHYHDARFVGRCVHPRDGITDADADAAVAILRGSADPRNLAPCEDCRAPAGAPCAATCPTRRDPPEAA